jgi:hypothetical protein
LIFSMTNLYMVIDQNTSFCRGEWELSFEKQKYFKIHEDIIQLWPFY